MIKVSYFAHIISGLLILLAIIIIIKNRESEELKGIKLANLVLFLSTAIGIHGISHILAEKFFDFNPLENKKLYY